MAGLHNASSTPEPASVLSQSTVSVEEVSVSYRETGNPNRHGFQQQTPTPTANELQRAIERLLAGVVRGAAIGLTLRGGLHLVGSLLAALSKSKRRSVAAADAVEDTLRYTAFLGALAGVYIGVDEGIAALVGKER